MINWALIDGLWRVFPSKQQPWEVVVYQSPWGDWCVVAQNRQTGELIGTVGGGYPSAESAKLAVGVRLNHRMN